jgi:uncharacterized protein YndB with AHSA1/START domain
VSEDYGTITKCYTVTFERRSKHSAARFWKALTEPDELEKWMGGPAKVDLRPGGEWFIDFPDTDDNLDGIIVRVEKELKLGYVWGTTYIEWAISDEDGGCTYAFLQNGLTDRGEGEEGLAAGWHGFFDQLDGHLDGEYSSREEQKVQWERLHAPYLERLTAAIR